MSLHSSLKQSGATSRHRNVLKREERIGKLSEAEKWKDGNSIFALPKVRSIKMRVKKKAKKKEEAAAGTEAVAGVAPAAGAAPAAAGAKGAAPAAAGAKGAAPAAGAKGAAPAAKPAADKGKK
jgi:small basic protein (TIGR04137 family)